MISLMRPDLPPPAYFVRSLPVMPLRAWIKLMIVSRGPLAAAMILAMAAGAGMAIGLRPPCAPPAPAPSHPGHIPHRVPPPPGP
ncbi:hypothetical protein [Sphaerisporangium sp. TRM90804]|uniref:hypothetical protein n=1 Tax=Sphaerisporangium sp. TRM90804 TaxID=3031113 RepID=UPI002449CAA2|nr:hypothetical protein [Sphaerisporangium sp. TRM90804]MDH2425503.1 hypothetical protein [Sphaerisporangium sp. TRM90804]